MNNTDNFGAIKLELDGGRAYHLPLPLDTWVIELPNHCNVVLDYHWAKKEPQHRMALGLSWWRELVSVIRKCIPLCHDV